VAAVRKWLAAGAALPLFLLVGCGVTPVQTGTGAPAAVAASAAPRLAGLEPAGRPVRLAAASLSDRQLGAVRGGFDVAPGLLVRFGFQQATFLNQNLIQSIVIPTVTVSVGTASLPGAQVVTTPSPGIPAQAANAMIASRANDGLTSVVTSLGGNALTTLVRNQANGRVVRQVTNMELDISGLSRMLVRNSSAMVANRIARGGAFGR
jgi:hypothetical protein